jgi:hypothetical protein
MSAAMAEAGLRRMRRGGILPLDPAQGLNIFDTALRAGEAVLLPIRLDLRTLAEAGDELPPMFRGLVPARRGGRATTATSDAQALRARLAELDGPGQEEVLLDLVRQVAAALLGHAGLDEIPPQRAFKELGFDSVTAVEFRNDLDAVTGLRLPATLIFDFPDARVLARHLATEFQVGVSAADPEDARVRRLLQEIPLSKLREAGLVEALLALTGLDDSQPAAKHSIDEMDAADLISMALGDTGA